MSLALGVVLTALLWGSGVPVRAQDKKGDFKRVEILTFDGVNLAGTLYPAGGSTKKEAVVLLLHDFDSKSGGNSHQDNWDKLAERLQEAGYPVLSFDFRGFGQSTTVNDKFWDRHFMHNTSMVKQRPGAGGKPSTTISHKDFQHAYYKYLVNDIAAAKAYLDERNDGMELNSGNVIVIGAGQGATLGAMWMASECRRCRAEPRIPGVYVPTMCTLDDPESKYLAAAVWLSISPTLAGQQVGPLVKNWLRIAGGEKQIPMAFVYAKKDVTGDTFAKNCLSTIKAATKTKLEFTGDKIVDDVAVTGSKLLNVEKTDAWIVNKYIEPLVKDRRSQGRKDRKVKENYYVYSIPKMAPRNAKNPKEEIPYVDVNLFFGR